MLLSRNLLFHLVFSVYLLGCQEEKYLIDLNEGSVCHYLETCCSPENTLNITQNSYKTESDDSQCGFANNKGIYMTLEGNEGGESDFGEFPWTVAILFRPSNTYLAGGSLIAPNVVLTSGNYLNVNDSLKVRAGDWDMWTDNEFLAYQERAVNQIIVHPNYALDTYENDIGLLILESNFHLGPHIQPICLSESISFDYGNCIVSGWNKVPRRGRLMVTKMPLSITNCTSEPIYESLLCVTGHSSNLKYSFGSALVCPKANDSTNQYFQVGAWSYGSSANACGAPQAKRIRFVPEFQLTRLPQNGASAGCSVLGCGRGRGHGRGDSPLAGMPLAGR
ncbi:hypothetical protein ACLKA7_003401 [Drosophila subpalustris]